MKKNKKIKLSLKKQTIVQLDNDSLKGIKGGAVKDQQFLSIFHCCTDNSRSCTSTIATTYCDITIDPSLDQHH